MLYSLPLYCKTEHIFLSYVFLNPRFRNLEEKKLSVNFNRSLVFPNYGVLYMAALVSIDVHRFISVLQTFKIQNTQGHYIIYPLHNINFISLHNLWTFEIMLAILNICHSHIYFSIPFLILILIVSSLSFSTGFKSKVSDSCGKWKISELRVVSNDEIVLPSFNWFCLYFKWINVKIIHHSL